MFQGEKIRGLLQSRRPFHPLPREFYADSGVYQADLNAIFHREWIFAGHTFELDKPGSYMTLQIGQYPIVIVRGRDGAVRAMHNVCRHRGSRVCTQASGRVTRLVCPYHQWAYNLDGTLSFARHMGPDFDKAAYGLKPVHCEIANSYIFVCISDTPPDFDAFHSNVQPFLAPHDLDNARLAHETHVVERGNWKLVFENNRECYHCDANHPQLMRSFVENRTVAGIDASDEDNHVTAHWARCEDAGFPSRLNLDRYGQFRMTRVPLAPGTLSYTMSGMPAVRTPLGDAGDRDLGVLLMFHYPSMWSHVLGDHAITFRVLPIGPNETLLTTKWIVHAEAEQGRDYDLDNLVNVWSQTNEQDRQVVEQTAQGVASPAFEPGPFSPEAENGPNQFVDWYCDFMAARLSETSDGLRAAAGL